MLRKIKLYGKLAKFIGHRVLEADVATAAEAVRFLLANWPELEAHMSDQHYRVSIGTYDIDLEELHHPAGAAPISFVPVVAGAGATGRIIAGALLIIGAYFYRRRYHRTAWHLPHDGWREQCASFCRRSLLLGGVAQLLTPTPKVKLKALTTKTTHARATASAASRIPAARVCRCPSSMAKRWSAA
jgi:predicted phage tail protein